MVDAGPEAFAAGSFGRAKEHRTRPAGRQPTARPPREWRHRDRAPAREACSLRALDHYRNRDEDLASRLEQKLRLPHDDCLHEFVNSSKY